LQIPVLLPLGKDSKSEAIMKRGHYGNYISQPNAKIPKTTFSRILNKSKMWSEDNLTCASENVLSDNKDLEANVFEPLQNELTCSIHAQLSSFVNDNPEILDSSGIPTCSQRSSHLESEVPTSLGSSEFQQPNGGCNVKTQSRWLTREMYLFLMLHHVIYQHIMTRSWCMVMFDHSGWLPFSGVRPRLQSNFGPRLKFLHVLACMAVMFWHFMDSFDLLGINLQALGGKEVSYVSDDCIIHYNFHTIQVFNHLIHDSLEDLWGTLYAKGKSCEPVLANCGVKETNTTLYEECEILKPTNTATTGIADEVRPWNFPEDDPALFDIRPAITFAADEEECLDDIWSVEEGSETSDRSATESENTSKENDTSGIPLFEGAYLTLDMSMLLMITFAMRHSITGVALADLLVLIEVHLISPNCFGHSMKLLHDFFKKLKNPIEFHYYCSFVEYIGAKRHPEHCTNKHCLKDFSKEGSLAYFIVVPFITQLQSLLAREEVYDLLQYRFTSKKEHESNIEDIFDGQLYLKHFAKDGSFRATSAEQKQKEIHLSLQINTDGVALFNSSKFSIWPVYCVINELPPKCRCTTTCTSGKP
ncbi:uncharacterized protein LOC110052285, partial [Orbicella faveolata]|uniref:uncharacterized protein LOC110052285 n=1 Tax=Orbicella faveolata TaxID=48498 RepID=UPI0009E37AB4